MISILFTRIIWQQILCCKNLRASCLDDEARQLMDELKKINIARRHKAFQPTTEAHKKFLKTSAEKARELQKKYPFLNLDEELTYFTS